MLKNQAGLTLIELMISLALGLVISAAAIMLFLTAQRSYTLQQGMTDLQDNANFGLNYITRDIRLTNLNASVSEINDQTSYGGVILTSSVNATKDGSYTPARPLSNLFRTIVGNSAGVNFLSRSNGMSAGTAPAWTGASNVITDSDGSLLSDQLTIQYRPQYILDDKGSTATSDDEWVGGYDCEGRELRFKAEDPGGGLPFGQQMVVQRYFLRSDASAASNEPNTPLALACEAGFYAIAETPTVTKVEGGAPCSALGTRLFGSTSGQIIMKRVDYFRVLLGVQSGANYRYISFKDYMDIAAGSRPRILSVQLGALVRSAQPAGNDAIIDNNQIFQVLDQSIKVKTPTASAPKYVRQVVVQNIALRNTFGERGK
ncbi:prepilin-type N-terminal cleavage/methylation domain-containing protein [Acinetobacter guerrae]|uniref:Prepilin-type N-terminal cleavage/methylation domain-containing protein n=1 Tax=Acinetobacter guerrae TaxID=1843371 RepID=A0A3A8EKT7_9GAMM|nr:PilW family protein [Acinetobacter guerrae]RKG31370.1 prepilin-type N-terminal cleavage/methylation domain-containing protein [Acinetobacter guerrae]